ncbi:glycosyltransferase [Corallincola luteus]|uniref:Glycosyltransferase n=1 Tax=Corallincola luteus TaxID=1775177 RepID=A0ABY2AFJ1_9GAMM|nr:glycosyltransferase [Corallincola luteus]TCI01183.1 glycosyltransferase [Corallincola luteus]
MTRILFTLIPEKGHINPYIGVAQHLQRAGVEVGFYASHDISAQLHAASLPRQLGQPLAQTARSANRGCEFAEQVSNAQWLRQWIEMLLVDVVEEGIAGISAAINQFKADIIITDPMLYGAAIAANAAQLPWVAISNSLNPVLNPRVSSELLDTLASLQSKRQALFSKHGMNVVFKSSDMLSPFLNIAFTTEQLVGPVANDVECVGPSIPLCDRGDETEFDWAWLDADMPLIYMSLGSQIYYQPQMFNTVFAAVRDMPVQLVATVSDLLGSDELVDLPDNVYLSRYTPQLSMLQRAAVMITHGGANSVMEAIHGGVPLLISPICNDQFHQAFYVAKQNIGRVLDLQQASVSECSQALAALLNDPEIQANMRRVSASYQVDGAQSAAQLVLALAESDYDH